VFAKTGRREAAERSFRRVLLQDEVQMVLVNGETASSHEIASRALASLQNGVLSR
jgi:C-terminal processing protease CtpA/Prc